MIPFSAIESSKTFFYLLLFQTTNINIIKCPAPVTCRFSKFSLEPCGQNNPFMDWNSYFSLLNLERQIQKQIQLKMSMVLNSSYHFIIGLWRIYFSQMRHGMDLSPICLRNIFILPIGKSNSVNQIDLLEYFWLLNSNKQFQLKLQLLNKYDLPFKLNFI